MRFQGFIQELLVSSMSSFEVVLALILGGVVRGILVGVLVTGICLALADVPMMHIGVTIFFVVVVAIIFSSAGFISAMWSDDFEHLSLFQTY
jgi:ABC-2 type transport system permease protein